MRVVIIYWSRYGNGRRAVQYLVERLGEKGVETQLLLTEEADPRAMPPADRYVFSAAAEFFNLQSRMRKFMKRLKDMEGKEYCIINTHGHATKNWLWKMEKLLSKKGMVKLAEAELLVKDDIEKGYDMKAGKGFVDGWEKKLDGLAERLLR